MTGDAKIRDPKIGNAVVGNPGLRAVLFDSGGVLMQPIGGRWNPRPDFEQNLLKHAPDLDPGLFPAAFAVGDRHLAATATATEDDCHREILRALAVEPTPELLADLSRPFEPSEFLEVFPDVLDTLEELKRLDIRMAVVSDAKPNLPDLHAGLGIHGYFEAYAISAVLGCTKPDPRIYHHASRALGLEPAQCVFVDDSPDLVDAAIELGYTGFAIDRDGVGPAGAPPAPTPVIRSLTELVPLFTGPDRKAEPAAHTTTEES